MKILKTLIFAFALFASSAFAQTPLYARDAIVQILHDTARDCPHQFSTAHREGSPERWDFIIEAATRAYRASGGTVGGNWRRGNVGDLSMDGFTYKATDGRFYFADVIAGAGGSNPQIVFNTTGEAPAIGFVSAGDLPRPVVPCSAATPGPVIPPPTTPPPATNLQPILDAIKGLSDQIAQLRAEVNAVAADARNAADRAGEVKAIAQNTRDRLEDINAQQQLVSNMLTNPPVYSGRAGFLGTVTLRPQPR